MKSEFGTYAIILRSRENSNVQIGRWGRLDLVPGYYVYVGSAFGPGGVRARVLRHCRTKKIKHWHIDFVREHITPISAWNSYETMRLEHHWAQELSKSSDMKSIPGFGCSDCKCASHFFYTSIEPDFRHFSNTIGGSNVEKWIFDGQPASASIIRTRI